MAPSMTIRISPHNEVTLNIYNNLKPSENQTNKVLDLTKVESKESSVVSIKDLPVEDILTHSRVRNNPQSKIEKDISSTSIEMEKDRFESTGINTSFSLEGSPKRTKEAFTMMSGHK